MSSGTLTAYEQLLDRLHDDGRVVRTVRPNQTLAQCPAHDDRNPSLSITQIEGQALLHCLAGDTRVITRDGSRSLAELAGQTATLLVPGSGGGVWQDAPVRSFGVQPLLRLTLRRFNAHKIIYATAEHRWFVEPRNGRRSKEVVTSALEPGMRLRSVATHRRVREVSSFGVAHGFTYGDGSLRRGDSGATSYDSWRVVSVEETDRVEEVYCATVEGAHAFALEDNILTGNCHAGCHVDDVLAALGLTARDLFDDHNGATYLYDDHRTVHRTWDKRFRQSGSTNGHQPVLYRLSRVQAAVAEGRTVWLVEGEKDVHAIEALGEVATTAPMGATNLEKCDLSPLTGAQVIAIPDRDEAGLKWAQQVQRALKGAARSLDFTIAKTGKDAADHIAAGHTVDEFQPVPPPLAADPDDGREDLRLIPGGNFILDTDPIPQPVWGEGERVLWADGEALIIAGPQGAGKTTLAQQVALGYLGIDGYADLLGFPITPGGRLLYLAMDRPRQAARSFRRMVTEDQREQLNERLVVWKGPPPSDLARHPSMLLSLCEAAQAQAVVVDSLKDAAIGLSDDDVGAGYNRARQTAIAAGVQVLELHHMRKAVGGGKAEHPTIDGIYGSTWITSGAGSVILLNGAPGDPIVTLHHLKQPAEEVGPFKVLHDDRTGRSTVWHEADLVEMVRAAGSLSAVDVAKVLFDTPKPTAAEKEKARRKLDRLVASGHLWLFDKGDVAGNRPALWAVR